MADQQEQGKYEKQIMRHGILRIENSNPIDEVEELTDLDIEDLIDFD